MAVTDKVMTDRYALYNGDCCQVMPGLPDESVGMVIYSPPFAGLFEYSSAPEDLSNCRTYEQFMRHYEFVVRETARLLKPGRIAAVHCMDVPKDGANICGYVDFPGDIIRLHERYGFEYLPRICIWKEPLGVRNRTMAKSLAHRQIVEDSCLTTVAASDYLLPFRKKGENPEPVSHPTGFHKYIGESQVPAHLLKYKGWTGKQTENRYSHWVWRQYASSHWTDIRVGRVLPYKESRDPQDERHVHPLQLDVIERSVEMWTNPNDVVLTPFMGVGSEVYGAVVNGRRGIGVELKPTYFRQAVANLSEIKADVEEKNLFSDFEDADEPAEVTA